MRKHWKIWKQRGQNTHADRGWWQWRPAVKIGMNVFSKDPEATIQTLLAPLRLKGWLYPGQTVVMFWMNRTILDCQMVLYDTVCMLLPFVTHRFILTWRRIHCKHFFKHIVWNKQEATSSKTVVPPEPSPFNQAHVEGGLNQMRLSISAFKRVFAHDVLSAGFICFMFGKKNISIGLPAVQTRNISDWSRAGSIYEQDWQLWRGF